MTTESQYTAKADYMDTRLDRRDIFKNSVQTEAIFKRTQFFKQGPAYKKEGPDPNKGSNQQ